MRTGIILLLSVLLFSCQNEDPKSKAEKMAVAVCNCSNQLLTLNKEAAAKEENIDFEAIQQAFMKARKCISELRMKAEDKQAMEAVLPLKCPELAAEAELLSELLAE